MELDKVIALIHAVSNSALTGFILDEGNLHLELQKTSERQSGKEGGQMDLVSPKNETEPVDSQIALEGAGKKSDKIPMELGKIQEISAESLDNFLKDERKESITAEKQVQTKKEGIPIFSPLVGTFYSAPSEGEPPFVKVGDSVKKGQVLGMIEAMKLMNEIECEQDGVITAIFAENEQMVEYGQKLFLIQ